MKKWINLFLILLFITSNSFAQSTKKVTALTEDGSPGTDSVIATVDDPSGTPTSKKATIANILTDSNIPNDITIDLSTSSSDLTCTNCIGGTEIDETTVDHDTLLNYSSDEHFTQSDITTVGTVIVGDISGIETDPQVGTLTNTKWCITDGNVINCTEDSPSGSGGASQLSELSDVGDSTATAGNLLIADGTNFTSQSMDGDVTIDSVGNTSLDTTVEHTWSGIQTFADVQINNDLTVDGGITAGGAGAYATFSSNDKDINLMPGSGNVGIGTTAPDAKLTVSGTTHITGNTTLDGTLTVGTGSVVLDMTSGVNTSGYIFVADGSDYNTVAVSGDITIDSTGDVSLNMAVEHSWTADQTFTNLSVSGNTTVEGQLNVASTGNTGIGTSEPSAKFEVVGNSLFDNVQIDGDLTLSDNTDGYILVADGDNFNPVAMSGDITIGSTGLTTIGADKIDEGMLNAANSPTDEYILSYESDSGNFEWVEMTVGGSTTLGDLTDVGETAYTAGSILVADGDSYEEVSASGDVTIAGDGEIFVNSSTPGDGTFEVDGDLQVGTSGVGSFCVRDTDDGGWTYITTLNGFVNAVIDTEGTCGQ